MNIVPMKVELIDWMGSDLSVVNAARVSFHKESGLENGELKTSDEKLIHYLAKHNHWTPFGHAFLSFRIKAPIFVARQLVKHQVGVVWNEVSRRYVDDEPEFFQLKWRWKPDGSIKQGSGNEFTEDVQEVCNTIFWRAVEHSFQAYQHLLDIGVAPEQARAVLSLNAHTEWIWSGSLAAFARVCKLRLDPHAQKETQEVAQQINNLVPYEFKHSWEALLGNA
jgi:thymidylate synthase (FAD)